MKTLHQLFVKFPWSQVYEAYGAPCSQVEARAKAMAFVKNTAGGEAQVHPVKVANSHGKGHSG